MHVNNVSDFNSLPCINRDVDMKRKSNSYSGDKVQMKSLLRAFLVLVSEHYATMLAKNTNATMNTLPVTFHAFSDALDSLNSLDSLGFFGSAGQKKLPTSLIP